MLRTLQNTEAQTTHSSHFCLTRDIKKMLRAPSAHCRIPKHKQPLWSISVRLATYGKCCAHLAHTAEYRSIPFQSDSRHTEHAAHSQRTLQKTEGQRTHWFHFGQTRDIRKCAHLAHTAEYRSTNNPLVPFWSYGKCCAHLTHTAEYRSTNNPLVAFLSDSRHTENAAHT
jgi:hypothetical protein